MTKDLESLTETKKDNTPKTRWDRWGVHAKFAGYTCLGGAAIWALGYGISKIANAETANNWINAGQLASGWLLGCYLSPRYYKELRKE
jgi:hypothetical protein